MFVLVDLFIDCWIWGYLVEVIFQPTTHELTSKGRMLAERLEDKDE